MKESTTYQAIIEEGVARGMVLGIARGKAEAKLEGKLEAKLEGKLEAARELLLAIGTKRFGPPDSETRTVLESIADYARLKTLWERVMDVSTWAELGIADRN